MKAQVAVVGLRHELPGYMLAGIRSVYDTGQRLPDDIVQENSIVLVTEGARKELGDKAKELREKALVLEIPGNEKGTRINAIIKKTIGFELRQ